MVAPEKMTALYGALTPTERARLMARINRTGAYDEMPRICKSVPDGQAEHYNHHLHILKRLHSPLASNLTALLLAAERDAQALHGCIRDLYQDRLRLFAQMGVWQLIAYPV